MYHVLLNFPSTLLYSIYISFLSHHNYNSCSNHRSFSFVMFNNRPTFSFYFPLLTHFLQISFSTLHTHTVPSGSINHIIQPPHISIFHVISTHHISNNVVYLTRIHIYILNSPFLYFCYHIHYYCPYLKILFDSLLIPYISSSNYSTVFHSADSLCINIYCNLNSLLLSDIDYTVTVLMDSNTP